MHKSLFSFPFGRQGLYHSSKTRSKISIITSYLKRISPIFWLSFALSAIFFWLFPAVDVWFSSLFFDGKRFYLGENFFVKLLYDYTQVFTLIVGLALLALLALAIFRAKEPLLAKKAIAFLLVSLIVGPGLVVNVVFKDNFGRARPAQIKEFGGQKELSRAFEISSNCQKNCSFACGHASAAFWFLSFAFIIGEAHRRKVLLGGLVFGSVVGFGRIVQGGHFLSDVIFAGFFVYLVSRLAYEMMIVGHKDAA